MTSVEPSRSSNARGRKASGAVLAAATELFAERGYNGVSIAEIAHAANVTKPAVLYHFPDKETLWKSCVAALWDEVDAFYLEHLANALPPSRARVEQQLLLFIEAGLRWPAYIRIPFIEGATPSWRSEWLVDKHFGRHVALNQELLRACQEQGLLRDGDLVALQAVLTSPINVLIAQGAMWDRAFGRDLDTRETLGKLVGAILDLTFRSETLAKPG